MNYEAIIALAVTAFFLIIMGYALFFGSNIPFLLAARQRAFKELDPNAALNVKSQIFDAAALSTPDWGLVRGWSSGVTGTPSRPLRSLSRGCWWTKSITPSASTATASTTRPSFWCSASIAPPPTTSDILIQASGIRNIADHFWVPSYCDPQGKQLPRQKLIELDERAKRYWRQLVADYMYATTININAKQQAQAQHGRDTSDILFPDRTPMAGGDPQAWEQDQLGQRVKQEPR